MSHPAIRVENLGKKFRIGTASPYFRFSELLQAAPRAMFHAAWQFAKNRVPVKNKAGFADTDHPAEKGEFWALTDLNFEVEQGEVLGIIGRNGAGKSTLLKVLSRITEPTTGRFGVNGRIGSLLEVGTGFHPELTGRENIFLSGTLLGMTKAEIRKHFDEIVAFAEIGEFLDTPVKWYSSGMYVKLGFAIAAHLKPEILIIDEVLAVGDAQFQKKCLGKMGDVAHEGRTVLFVSHNHGAVRNLCRKALWIERGRLQMMGDAAGVVDEYAAGSISAADLNSSSAERGNDQVRIHPLGIMTDQGTPANFLTLSTAFAVRFVVENRHKRPVTATLLFLTSEGIVAFVSSLCESRDQPAFLGAGRHSLACKIPGDFLNRGRIAVKLLIVNDLFDIIFTDEELTSFTIVDSKSDRGPWRGESVGVVRPRLNWQVGSESAESSS